MSLQSENDKDMSLNGPLACAKTLERFLDDPTKKVFLLKGRWGVGKSHCVLKVLRARQKQIPSFAFSYVSLFGLTNIEAALSSIVANIEVPRNTFKGTYRLLRQLHALAVKTPVIKEWAEAIPFPKEFLLKDMLIVFDDLERLSPDLSVATVMGLIANLKERKGCRVILICHQEAMRTLKEEFEKVREKIIDQEVLYAPSQDELIPLIFEKSCSEELRRVFRFDGTSNIRILQQVKWAVDEALHVVSGEPEWVQKNFATQLATLVVIRHQYPAVDLSKLPRWIASGNFKVDDELASEDLRKAVSRKLHYDPTQFDPVLIRYLETGFLDQSALLGSIELYKRSRYSEDVRAELLFLWDQFNGTFFTPEESMIPIFRGFYQKYAKELWLHDIYALANALSDLGSKEELTNWIEEWFATVLPQMKMEAIDELLKVNTMGLAPEINARLVARLHELTNKIPFAEIAKQIARTNSWNPRDLQILGTISPDAIRDWVLTDDDETVDILKNLTRIFRPDGDERFKPFALNLKKALNMVAQTSKLNRLRVERFVYEGRV